MDAETKRIYDAFRKATARLAELPDEVQDEWLVNVKATDLVKLLDALQAKP